MAVKFLDGITVTGGNIRIDDTKRLEFGSGGVRINNDAAGRMYYNAPLGYYWQTTGGYRMVIDSSGRVGIGTTSPDSKLEVIGNYKQKAADGNSQGFTLSIDPSTDAVSLNNYYNASMIFSTNNSAKMTILGSGNVGIGTTSPGAKLDVISEARISYAPSSQYRVRITNSDGNGRILVDGDTSSLIFGTSGSGTGATATERIRINSAGNVGIGTTSPGQKLTVAGVIKIDTSSDKQMQFARTGGNTFSIEHDAARMYFYNETSANVPLTLLNNGNVGIGTTSPTEKLDVSGNINATGSMECTKFIANAGSNFEFDIVNNAGFNMRHTVANQSMFFLTAAGTGEIKFGTNNTNSRVIITNTGALKSTVSLAVGAITPSTTVGRIDAANDVVAFSTSDIRLKDNIKSIDKALDKVNSIQGIEFDWIEKEEVHGNSGHDIGVIAQEIEKILPDVVTTRDNGYKAVKYEKIVPLLIEAIKDLSKQVDGLKRLI